MECLERFGRRQHRIGNALRFDRAPDLRHRIRRPLRFRIDLREQVVRVRRRLERGGRSLERIGRGVVTAGAVKRVAEAVPDPAAVGMHAGQLLVRLRRRRELSRLVERVGDRNGLRERGTRMREDDRNGDGNDDEKQWNRETTDGSRHGTSPGTGGVEDGVRAGEHRS